jgi:hypothetical protein
LPEACTTIVLLPEPTIGGGMTLAGAFAGGAGWTVVIGIGFDDEMGELDCACAMENRLNKVVAPQSMCLKRLAIGYEGRLRTDRL